MRWQRFFIQESREIKTAHEQEKALKETIIRVKKNSIEERSAKLDPTDIQGLQKLMEAKTGSCRTLKNCIFLLIKDKIKT